MSIRINWNQGIWDIIRAHQIKDVQPDGCQFNDMKGNYTDFNDIQTSETAMRQKGIKKYRRCSHCWTGIDVDLV